MDFISLLLFFAFIVNFFLSLLIHFRTTKTKANITFEVAAFAITGWCLATLFYRESIYLTPELWAKLLYVFAAFIPTFLLLFGLYFPDKPVRNTIPLSIIAANAIMALLTLSGNYVIHRVDVVSGQENVIYFGAGYYFLYIFYILFYYALTYLIFIDKYLRMNSYRRIQMLYILLGTTVVSVATLITNIILPTFGVFQLNWLAQILTVFWVGGVAYAMIKHRLMDIRIMAARAVLYTALLSVLGGMYATGVFLLGQLLVEDFSNEVELAVSLVLSLFIVLTFQPLKRILERATNSIFYRDRYEPNEMLVRLGKIATSSLNLTTLIEMILQELLAQIKPSYVSLLVLKNKSFSHNKTVGEGTEIFPEFEPDKIHQLIDHATSSTKTSILVYEEMDRETSEKKIMREYEIKLFVPLIVKNAVVGVLMMGDKSSGEMYTVEDIEMFRILSAEIAVSINNSLSYEEILHFNETLEQKVKRATQNLERANDRLKQLDKAKDEFVSIASHELRTPLSVIRSYLWMMLQNKAGKVNHKQKMYLEHAFTTAERLIDLVNDMLNVARIESGRMSLVKLNTDMTMVVKNVITGMKLRAQELTIHIRYDQLRKDIPNVEIDSEKIEQVLINLLGNSLKFTPAGGKITVTVDYDTAKKEVVVCVADTGIGIRKDNLNKLFRKFASPDGDYRTRNNMQSTGLGLYISRAIIKMNGGRMWAESDGEGKGAQFYFSIPASSK